MPYQVHFPPMKQRLLSVALSALLGGLAYQGDASANDTVNHYHIPAQSLNNALMQFAAESNLELVFPAEKIRGIPARALEGSMTHEQALSRLLADSGISYRFVDSHTVTLDAQTRNNMLAVKSTDTEAPTGDLTMPKVKVKASAIKSETSEKPISVDSDSPYNTSYTRSQSATATKTSTPLMQTPMSIQIVPQQVLNDQQAIRLEDALKNVSGVSREVSYGSANTYDSFTIRGFGSEAAVYRNGIRLAEQTYEVANLQQLEVLKGPAAIMYGRIEPGGMVNMTTKKPLDTPYYSLQQQFGSYDLYRTTADATGPLTHDGSLLYRLNIAYSDANSFRDFTAKERVFVAPSLTWRPSQKFEANVNFEYRDDTFNTDNGIPPIGNRPANVPISFSTSEDLQQTNLNSYTVGMDWTYKFNDDWKVTNRFLFQRADYNWNDFWQAGASLNPETNRWVVDRSGLIHGPGTTDNYATNLDLNGHFQTFGIKHNVLLGFDYYRRDRHDYDNNWDALSADYAPPLDVFNPVHGQVRLPDNLDKNVFWLDESEWTGVYFQDQITVWDKLHILLGGRYDSAFKQTAFASSREEISPTRQTISEANPRFGVLYQAMNWLSVYGNYVESVGRDNGRGAGQIILAPEHAKQYEFGLKTQFFDGALTSTLAYYHIKKTNITTPDFSTPDPYDSRSICGARSQGIELDVAGKIRDLSLIATYAFTDARITKDTDNDGGPGNTGNRLHNVPEHSGSLWAKYDFNEHFTLGTGTYFAGQREANLSNTVQMPGYVRWDAMAAYHFNIGKSRLTTQFNVNNILDKHYYLSSNSGPQILPADPLTFMGSVKLEF